MDQTNCTSCGSLLPAGASHCTNCGQPVAVAAPVTAGAPEQQASYATQQQPQQVAYGAASGQQQAPYGQQQAPYGGVPYQNQNQNQSYNGEQGIDIIPVWQFILIPLINIVPFIGSIAYLVLMFMWAFGSSQGPNHKNYARAALLSVAISVVLVIIVLIIVFATIGSAASAFSRYY